MTPRNIRAFFVGGSLSGKWRRVPGARFHITELREEYRRIRVVYGDGGDSASDDNLGRVSHVVYRLERIP